MRELDRKPFNFPRWVEAVLVVALLIMCVVEFAHWQILWSLLFGVAAIFFGISLAVRTFKGDPNGPE